MITQKKKAKTHPAVSDTTTRPVLKITLSGLSNADYRDNAKAYLTLFEMQNQPIKNPQRVRYLIRAGVKQIQQSLQPFGYYLTQVKAQLNPSRNQWRVNYQIQLGKPVRVNQSVITILGEGRDDPSFQKLIESPPFKKGAVLVQRKYTDFKDQLAQQALTAGYFDAQFLEKKLVLSDDFLSANLFLTYDTGVRYRFGQVRLVQDFLNQDFFDRYKKIKAGTLYASKKVATLQRDLYNSGYVKTIDSPIVPNKQSKRIPITLKITPKKNKKHTFGIGYGTDTGARASYHFDWRWVNRQGHQFKSNAFVSQKNLKLGAQYKILGRHPANDNYLLFTHFNRHWRESDKVSTLWNIGGAYQDVNGHLSREFGIKFQQEDFTVGNDRGNIGLLTPYARLVYRKKDDPLNIKDGLFVAGYVAVASDQLLSDTSLFQLSGDIKYIKTLAQVHRFRLAAGAGRTWTKDFHQLPTAYRFFTGGDKTVRGYSFESIGDRDASNHVIGGDKMYFLSAQYEYFLREKMAVAAFVDAGDAYSSESAKLKVGAGLGLHYYSLIGPIKVDIAHGFDAPGDRFRVHFSIGAEF